MKPGFVIAKMLAVIVGMVLLCAALLGVVAAVGVDRTPEPFRLIGQWVHELSLTLEDKEQMLADEIAQFPAVKSAVVANTEAWQTRINVVTEANPSDEVLGRISDKCIYHGILVTLDDLQPVVCTVSTEDGTLLATYESGT
ncbi:hypothetical protein ACSYDW_08695 [Paeniglutamicibacter sp. R2-26]|uniref:hypothetical protein n=1 Tax=Paeniglutamicibacter sp. R2-26 TaxID=3144417 RepID=UPI003EE80229